jgi:hypothetical protein
MRSEPSTLTTGTMRPILLPVGSRLIDGKLMTLNLFLD